MSRPQLGPVVQRPRTPASQAGNASSNLVGTASGDLIRSINTDIVIDVPLEQVWLQLIDLARWAEWNPFIREIEGDPAVGSKLRVVLQAPRSSRATTFHPTVVANVPGERFEWLGSVGTKGIADGHHIFELEPADGGKTRFVQREEFTGWAVGLLWPLFRKAEPGFVAMNQALKKRSENTSI